MKCNHKNKMFPVKDGTNWVVGWLCDCGFFQIRRDLGKYNNRLEAYIKHLENKENADFWRNLNKRLKKRKVNKK